MILLDQCANSHHGTDLVWPKETHLLEGSMDIKNFSNQVHYVDSVLHLCEISCHLNTGGGALPISAPTPTATHSVSGHSYSHWQPGISMFASLILPWPWNFPLSYQSSCTATKDYTGPSTLRENKKANISCYLTSSMFLEGHTFLGKRHQHTPCGQHITIIKLFQDM